MLKITALFLVLFSFSLAHAASPACEKLTSSFEPSEMAFSAFTSWPSSSGFLDSVEKNCGAAKAKELVISYLFSASGLTTENRRVLFLQAAELSQKAGDADDATKYSNMARAKLSKQDVQWNLYVDAYQAFLKKDAETMSEIRRRMLSGPSISGKPLYLSQVDDLVKKLKK